METSDPVVAEWIRAGVVRPPTHKKAPLPASPLAAEEGTAAQLLEPDRS